MELSSSTLFQQLITQRGWRDPDVFLRRYQEAARELAALEGPQNLATATIERRQFIRWARGEIKGQPRKEARRILAHLFRPVGVERLFVPPPSGGTALSERRHTGDFAHGCSHVAAVVDRDGDESGEDVVMAAANESADFAVRVDGSNVGPATLEQLEADIRRMVLTYPHRPVGPLFTEVRRLRNRAFELIEGRQPPHHTVDLYLAAGILCGVLANASFDLGRYEAADTQARTAFLCGQAAGHNGLRAWVRGLQALIAYWDGRPQDAVRLADAGGHFRPEQGTAAVRLAAIKARAHGQLRQSSEVMTALKEADLLRDRARTGDELPGGMMDFPQEKQLFYRSSAQLWLGGRQQLADAEAAAAEAVRGFESALPEQRRLGEMSLARLDLATARMGRGDLEGAAVQVHDVMVVNSRRGTESVRKRLAQFARRLAGHPGARSPMAVGLQEALAAHQERFVLELPPGDAA
ncbi:hypothetical protein [Streptomyces clavuligerus]|nr:hypothetical protein [Streptomyces clavuligerus]ANW18865.1 hypothetical protein BB341_11810 [Streptomyces clavuligerus]AXU13438.1 hypothetical protein D1794_12220 [Streptomyces clavuligerus]EDY47993.1 tetratricopeptide TPR-4 [Streptomyces clavuligerus]MBY6303398.1 hypothetical protein [Streptomyces clavuligerus]QCS06221.1 hypothetical protein CRV15_11650 [Streptomyces clavuligerus]